MGINVLGGVVRIALFELYNTTGADVMKILGKPHESFHIIFPIFSLLLELNACMKNPRKLNVS